MIKVLIPYGIWTAVSVFVLKSGLDLLLDKSTGFISSFLITAFIHITVVFPLVNSKRTNENS